MKLNIEVKETRQKLNQIIIKENINPNEKKLEIQGLKEKQPICYANPLIL